MRILNPSFFIAREQIGEWSLLHYSVLESTNDLGRECVEAGGAGIAVRADVQTAGRGRGSRTWESPLGGLYQSFVFGPEKPKNLPLAPKNLHLLLPLVAVAAAETIEQTVGVPVRIKWPNDLLISGKKVGGLLAETRCQEASFQYVIVGIGINLTTELSKLPARSLFPATTVFAESNREISPLEASRILCLNAGKLMDNWRNNDSPSFLSIFRRRIHLPDEITLDLGEGPIRGTVLRLLDDCRLEVRLRDGEILPLVSGDIIDMSAAASDLR